MACRLPTYRGFFVDMRLREFRSVNAANGLTAIPFASDEGDQLFREWLETPDGKREYRRAKDNGWTW
jgi:hypothetical protein